MPEAEQRISVYPSELLFPFHKIKAELAEKYKHHIAYYAARETCNQLIEAMRALIAEKTPPSEVIQE